MIGTATALDTVRQDLTYALRLARRTPAFTATAILSLGLGIGATTAIFSVLDRVLLRPLPVRAPGELVELRSQYPGEPAMLGFPWRVYEHFRDHNHVFSDLLGIALPAPLEVRVDGREPESLPGLYVTGNFFPALGLQPAAGRLLGPDEDRVGAPEAAAVVVSWAYWQRAFNLDPSITGKRLLVNGVPAAIVGVAPRTFAGVQVGLTPDLWMPAAMEALLQRPSRRATGDLDVALMGRLKPGVSLTAAQAEMRGLDRFRVDALAKKSRDPLVRQLRLDLAPAGAGFSLVRQVLATPLLILMAIVGVLLVLACANIASLLLARGAARQREMAVRVALGARRLRLVRQVLTESALLAAAGGLLGVVIAELGAQTLVRVLTSGGFRAGPVSRLHLQVDPDLRVLMFTALVAASTGLLFGLAPAWAAFASAPASSLREIGSASEPRSRRFFGKGLVVAQVALSVVMVSAATLFVQHLSNLRHVGLGFQSDSVLLVTLNPRGAGYDREQLRVLYRELLSRLQALPGVRSVTVSGATPIEGAGASRFAKVEGFDERPEDRRYLSVNWVGPQYFDTFGTPVVAGREFRADDSPVARVAIVNQAMARYYFGDASPLGKRLTFDEEAQPYEIVGLVGDAKYTNVHEPPPRTVYLSAFEAGRVFSQFALRTTVPPAMVGAEARRTVTAVLKNIAIAKVTTLSDQIDAAIVPERLIALLSGIFGAIAALLAAIGLYGLIAYTVARRTSEIGLRMVLGATAGDVTLMVLRGAIVLVVTGLAIGTPAAIWGMRVAASAIADLRVSLTQTIVLAAVVMIAVAMLAVYLPARRAARVQPMEALRQ